MSPKKAASAAASLSWRQILAWRLQRQHLVEPPVVVTVEPFEKLPRWANARLTAEAESLARFFGKDLQLQKPTG